MLCLPLPFPHSSFLLVTMTTSSYQLHQDEEEWRITDFGHVRERSRDKSIHATDEVFNAASHLVACVLSLLGTVLLVVQSSVQQAPWKIVSFSIYGTSLVFLFAASTLHHSVTGERIEALFRKLDYIAIYPLIAGTFTPLCLVYYHSSYVGWVFLSVVWVMAILGIVATALFFEKIPKWLSMTMYVTLGWLGACMSYWLFDKMKFGGFLLFLVGGLCYTGGGYIYSTEQPNPIPGKFGFHEIWHCFVILGALFHWLLMYVCVLPY
jgi:hemolysin III